MHNYPIISRSCLDSTADDNRAYPSGHLIKETETDLYEYVSASVSSFWKISGSQLLVQVSFHSDSFTIKFCIRQRYFLSMQLLFFWVIAAALTVAKRVYPANCGTDHHGVCCDKASVFTHHQKSIEKRSHVDEVTGCSLCTYIIVRHIPFELREKLKTSKIEQASSSRLIKQKLTRALSR